METKYVVVNENTLCYRQDGTDMLGVLSGSVLRGGHSWLDGPISVTRLDKVRPATQADFDFYRVSYYADTSSTKPFKE